MSESKQSPVFMFDNSDPQMQKAYEGARASFRYFWREIAWERRRIVPALDLACIKAPFSDGDNDSSAQVEQMWVSDVDFDGRNVSGTLLNSPNWVKSVKEGDSVSMPLDHLTDWMYATSGNVFGAYTVNLMRSRMSPQERKQHDAAWGMNFGDPVKIRIAAYLDQQTGFLKGLFKKSAETNPEHPMTAGMASQLQQQIKENSSMMTTVDDQGRTFLHQEALAGNLATVQVLLKAGADRNAKTKNGMTPLQLAKSLNWDHVVEILSKP